MKRGLSSGRKTRLVFRGTCGTATHGGGPRSCLLVFPSRLRLLWCLVGRHQRPGGCGFGSRRFWTRGRVARFKSWPLRRLLALETLLEKATAPPFGPRLLWRVCPGTCARLPALETQRELLPRPYLLALRRGEAARFKEQPALVAAARRPSSDCFSPFRKLFFLYFKRFSPSLVCCPALAAPRWRETFVVLKAKS